ncbi:RepB family plasmid replication initiator protein [Mammaliicoccus sciuri]|uniref:RepB family plasmid replication initiator protein n=1 Tax=Mammaliicoccus sciuri TaxID=1296 RepID=UPI0024363F4F|nr:RepB family plasmid replication initiator protein [Mammaliicoccus sciuri]
MTKHHEQTIVQYHTDLNDIVFKGFKAVELNLFFAICSLLKDRGSERIILDIDEIKKIAHYTSRSKKRFEPDLMNVIEKVMALSF